MEQNLAIFVQIYIEESFFFMSRDSNPGPIFSILGFGIGKFLILRSRRDYGITAV